MSDAQPIQIRPDLYIGFESPNRKYGSNILNKLQAERRVIQQKKQQRNYAGAKISRLNTGWGGTPTPPNWHIWQGLQQLRSRSREQYRNNDYARRFIAMCKNNIIGPDGILLQSKAADVDGAPDRLAQKAIEKSWATWSRQCDVSGRLTLTEMLRLIIATVAIDGECLVRRISSGAFGVELKLIDPEWLDIRYNRVLNNGNVIRMGVESDGNGKRLAYYLMLDDDSLHLFQSSYYTGKHIRIPADEILHIFLPEMIDQSRGVPWMSSAIERMKHLSEYENSAVINSRIGASKMGFFTTADGDGAETLADAEDPVSGEFIQDAEAGAFEVLPNGYDFKSFNPDYPHQQFPFFVKACLRGISAGLGVAYNGLANDLEGVNFSSIRAGVLEEREQWKTLQDFVINHVMRPLFEHWLDVQLMLGTIKIPTKSGIPVALPSGRFDKFANVRFQARRWAWVDPLKDMAANKAAVENKFRSRSDIIRDMGREPEDVWEEIAKEDEILSKLGLIEVNNETV